MRGVKVLLLSVLSCLTMLSPALAKNVVLLIGDGMGFEHVQAGRLYVYGSDAGALSFETLPFHGSAATTLPNGGVTDSATAGTALATGYQHPVNGTISTDSNGNPVETILEKAKAMGLRTGIITTDDIAGATPGSFGAHEPDRNLMSEIRLDFLLDDTDHYASLPNILFGGGASDAYSQTASSVGYSIATDGDSLWSMVFETLPYPLALGQFAPSTMTRENDRAMDNAEPRLSEMVVRALDLLSQEPNGFFLVVEGALIDKISHDNAYDDLCPEVEQFHLAVQSAMDWVAANGGDGETLLLVTADHETGSLNVPDGQAITPGSRPVMQYTSTGHSAADVPVFATWPASVEGTRIDNTETFFLMEDWLFGGAAPAAENLLVSNIKQTSATVSWSTREPAYASYDCYLGSTLVASDYSSGRTTSHLFEIQDLQPNLEYTLLVNSEDLAGFIQTETISFATATPAVDAFVAGDPAVSIGSVSGSFASLALKDGLVQSILEAPSGIGARLDATYVLHTSAQVNSIVSITLNADFSWTKRDKDSDHALFSILNVASGNWEPLSQDTGGSFMLALPQGYVDSQGNIHVRFTDSATISREKKDSLAIDQLMANVVVGPPDVVAPAIPVGLVAEASQDQELTASLAWSANPELDTAGYYVQRVGFEGTFYSSDSHFIDHVMTAGYYEYQVCAFDLSGNRSDWSDPVGVQLENTSAPIAPQNLVATAGDGTAFLDWTDNPEWDVVGYNLYQLVNDTWVLVDEGIVNSEYTLTGLLNGQAYLFHVTASDSTLESTATPTVQVIPSTVPKVLAQAISVSLQLAGKNCKATASIQVVANGLPVAGATVTGNWLFNGNILNAGVSGTTDAAGNFVSTSSPVKTSSGTFTFQIVSIDLQGYEYDSSASVTEASKTL